MSLSLVQSAPGSSGSSGAVSATNTGNVAVTTGNALVFVVETFGNPGSTTGHGTISDTKTGTWTPVFYPTSDGENIQWQIWICNNPQTGVAHAVTFTPQDTNAYGSQCLLMEWSGGPFTYDTGGNQYNSSTSTALPTPSITPAANGELLLAMGACALATHTTSAPTNGFTSMTTHASSNPMSYLVDSAHTSINTSWTISATDVSSSAIVALSGAGTVSSGLLPLLL